MHVSNANLSEPGEFKHKLNILQNTIILFLITFSHPLQDMCCGFDPVCYFVTLQHSWVA